MADDDENKVVQWLAQWEDRIASQDFQAARELFDLAAIGFGTVAPRANGLDDLVERQWRVVWTRNQRFRFLPETLVVWADGSLLVAAVQWQSVATASDTGEPYCRDGRATIVLRETDCGVRALHTHFSISPVPERFLPYSDSEGG